MKKQSVSSNKRRTPTTSRKGPKRTPAKTVRTSRIQKKHIYGVSLILIVLGVGFTFANALLFNNGKIDLIHAATSVPVIGSASAPANYALAWNDEFNGTSVDSSKWNVLNNSNYGTGGKEDECYYRNNVAVSGGSAKLTAKRQTVTCGGTNPDTGKSTYYVTSGFMTTRAQGGGSEKFAFTKGYVEAAIRLPKGNPYWGAFWLVGGNGAPGWPQYGEMDVMEQVGPYPDSMIQTFHYTCGSNDCNTSSANNYNLATGSAVTSSANRGTMLTTNNFNSFSGITTTRLVRYGILWEGNRLTWYVDGRPTRSFDGQNLTIYTTNSKGEVTGSSVPKSVGNGLSAVSPSWSTVMSYPHTIILNLAYGGSVPRYAGYTGGETSTGYNDGNLAAVNPGTMEIDYIRVYQPGSGGTTTTPTTPSADTTKPSVTSMQPVADATVKGTTVFKANASDNSGVATVKLYIDGYLRTTDTSSPYDFSFDTTKLSNATHTYYFVAADTAGNTATSAKVVFHVDNTAPPTTQPTTPTSPTQEEESDSPSEPTAPIITIDNGTPVSVEPIEVPKDSVIVIEKDAAGGPTEVKIDGKTTDTSIDSKKLTNGEHTIEITEDGKTVTHTISVHNPWYINVINTVSEHPYAYGGSALGGIVATGYALLMRMGKLGGFFRLFGR